MKNLLRLSNDHIFTLSSYKIDNYKLLTSNLLRITLRQIDGQPWMITRGSYVHKPMVKFLGPQKTFPPPPPFKILMVSDQTIHRAFKIHKTLSVKPIRVVVFCHYLPKLYFGFNCLSFKNIFKILQSLWVCVVQPMAAIHDLNQDH